VKSIEWALLNERFTAQLSRCDADIASRAIPAHSLEVGVNQLLMCRYIELRLRGGSSQAAVMISAATLYNRDARHVERVWGWYTTRFGVKRTVVAA